MEKAQKIRLVRHAEIVLVTARFVFAKTPMNDLCEVFVTCCSKERSSLVIVEPSFNRLLWMLRFKEDPAAGRAYKICKRQMRVTTNKIPYHAKKNIESE